MEQVVIRIVTCHDSADDLAPATAGPGKKQRGIAVLIEGMFFPIEEFLAFENQRRHPSGIVLVDLPRKFNECVAVFTTTDWRDFNLRHGIIKDLRGFPPRRRELEQRSRQSFLLKNEIDEKEVEHAELDPKVPNRPANEQKKKEEKHSRVRHQQSPPFEHRPGRITISRLQPNWNFAWKIAPDRLVQPFQAGREHLLLPGENQIQREQTLIPGFAPAAVSPIFFSQDGR